VKIKKHIFLTIVFAWLMLAGCQGEANPERTPSDVDSSQSETPGPTATSFLPPLPDASPTLTPTPVPLALTVKGIPVTLDAYNLALQRFHLGIPDAPTEEAQARVVGDYIEQILLEQAAYEAGFTLTDADWQARYGALIQEAGGEEAFSAWLEANLYPRDLFEQDLRRSFAAAWMRDRIFNDVPLQAEQVRARHIRVSTREEAQDVLAQLNGGISFDIMVSIYDPAGLGDLGWFPHGVLFQKVIEDTAFALTVGSYSDVVQSDVGFHIVQTTDYDADRPLDPDNRWLLQLAALDAWVKAAQADSVIELFIR